MLPSIFFQNTLAAQTADLNLVPLGQGFLTRDACTPRGPKTVFQGVREASISLTGIRSIYNTKGALGNISVVGGLEQKFAKSTGTKKG